MMIAVAMTMTVKVLGYAGQQRRAAEHRQRAMLEASNVMERIAGLPFDEVTPERARPDALRGVGHLAPRRRADRRGEGGTRDPDRPVKRMAVPAALEGPIGRVGSPGPAHDLDRAEDFTMIAIRPTPRRGVTLIEMMVVITALAILMGLCAWRCSS